MANVASIESHSTQQDAEVRLPHHTLHAWQLARELLLRVRALEITDASLRDQAQRAAQSCCLNLAEGCGRDSAGERRRAWRVARGEACELAAAIELALLTASHNGKPDGALQLAARLVAVITGLTRR